MNKEMFLFLLGIRAELRKEADVWIEFGIDIDSKRTEALWKIREQIVKQCEKELKLPVSEHQYTTLSWALEHLDRKWHQALRQKLRGPVESDSEGKE